MQNLEFIEKGWLNVKHIKSPNYNQRPDNSEISLVVIHNICLPPDDFNNHTNQYINKFFTNCLESHHHQYFEQICELKVSSHFLVQRNSDIIQYVSTDDRAWHAGKSVFNHIENCNDYSIGIELEGSDNHEFTSEQYNILIHLIQSLKLEYPSIKYITAHSYISPNRKTDPGPYFKWEILNTQFNDIKLVF